MGRIRVASIIGFIFSVILIIYFFYSFISGLSADPFTDTFSTSQTKSGGLVLPIILGVVLFGAFFFFMFGFIKTGEKTNHNMLRLSSWMVFGSIALILVLALVLAFSVKSAVDDATYQFDPNSAFGGDLEGQIDFSDFDFESTTSGFGGGFTGNAVGDLTSDFFNSDLTFLLILFLLGILVFLVGIHLFYVAIAEHRDKIKFARPSAIFGLLTFNFIFLVAAMSIFLLILFFTSGNFLIVFVTHIPFILGIFTLVYMSLFLRDASEKFE